MHMNVNGSSMPVRTLVTLGVAAAGSFRGNPDGSARTPRRPCRHAPCEDRARFRPFFSSLFARALQKSTAAGAAQRGVPATRADRPRRGPSDARGSSAARSRENWLANWLADSGQGSDRWAERRRASEAPGKTQRGVHATRAGRPERVPATRAGRPRRQAELLDSLDVARLGRAAPQVRPRG